MRLFRLFKNSTEKKKKKPLVKIRTAITLLNQGNGYGDEGDIGRAMDRCASLPPRALLGHKDAFKHLEKLTDDPKYHRSTQPQTRYRRFMLKQ